MIETGSIHGGGPLEQRPRWIRGDQMASANSLQRAAKHLDELLTLERQIWLCGAGISVDSGIPLMFPLTDRVRGILKNPTGIVAEDTTQTAALLKTLCDQMPPECHIEHHLSQIGDLITLAERKTVRNVVYGSETFTDEQLKTAHRHIQIAIRHTVEFGYVKEESRQAAQIGTVNEPVTTHEYHDEFVTALFAERRAGLERRPAIRFFTTNYDTLLEDSLARCCIPFADGFTGGATAFWDPRNLESRIQALEFARHSAVIYKLHGSIDWVFTENEIVMRVRTSAVLPLAKNKNSRLLIYPQATKYLATQRDPFARLFADFRTELSSKAPTAFVVCGYSFGDDHINEEIDRALRQPGNAITLIACCSQRKTAGKLDPDEGLPPIIAKWLKESSSWNERIVVLGSDGYYRGSLTNRLDTKDILAPLDWWTFRGITQFLKQGPEMFP